MRQCCKIVLHEGSVASVAGLEVKGLSKRGNTLGCLCHCVIQIWTGKKTHNIFKETYFQVRIINKWKLVKKRFWPLQLQFLAEFQAFSKRWHLPKEKQQCVKSLLTLQSLHLSSEHAQLWGHMLTTPWSKVDFGHFSPCPLHGLWVSVALIHHEVYTGASINPKVNLAKYFKCLNSTEQIFSDIFLPPKFSMFDSKRTFSGIVFTFGYLPNQTNGFLCSYVGKEFGLFSLKHIVLGKTWHVMPTGCILSWVVLDRLSLFSTSMKDIHETTASKWSGKETLPFWLQPSYCVEIQTLQRTL